MKTTFWGGNIPFYISNHILKETTALADFWGLTTPTHSNNQSERHSKQKEYE